jgi:hypothetical protein
VNKFAVERASLALEDAEPAPGTQPRLSVAAVKAFWAEITRLASHWPWIASSLEKATAHTTPSGLTTVAHIFRPRPRLPPTDVTAVRRALCKVVFVTPLMQAGGAAKAMVGAMKADAARSNIFFNIEIPLHCKGQPLRLLMNIKIG